jgi:hypothetical protein
MPVQPATIGHYVTIDLHRHHRRLALQRGQFLLARMDRGPAMHGPRAGA